MGCLICDGADVVVNRGEYYQERTCPKCGHYKITGSALQLLNKHDWRLDMDLVHHWIEVHRSTGVTPTINSYQVSRLIGMTSVN